MKSFFQTILTSTFLSFCLISCSSVSPKDSISQLPSLVSPQGDTLFLEIADEVNERRDGLMFRTELDGNAGMIFIFDDEAPRSFWMKNTLIPLDVVYIDELNTIVDIQTMPPCGDQIPCPSYPSAEASIYAVEMNAGKAQSLGLSIGDTVTFQGISF